MGTANKGAVSAAVIAGIAGDAGNGIQGGDVLVVPGAAPDVRIVGINAGGRVVTPNLLEVPSAADFAALLPLSSDCVATLANGAVNELVGNFALTFGPNADAAPTGTSVLVSYLCSAPVIVTLGPASPVGSSLVGQAANGNEGLVWATVGVGGIVELLFTAVALDTLTVSGQQSAGLGAIGSDSSVFP